MEFADTYMNFKPTYKYYYLKNNNICEFDLTTEELFSRILQDIDIVLRMLKISPSKVGYAYWRDAILIYILSEKDHLSICNDVYPMIAQKYCKTTISIERAMRLCFEDTMYNSINENNYVVTFMKHYLVQPHNSEIMVKLAELVTSSGFRRFKNSISN